MSQNGVDTQMISKAQSLMSKFGQMTPAPNVFRFASDTQRGANENVAFPVQLGSTDKDDEKYHLRSQFVGAGGDPSVVPGVGMAVADEGFFDYANRKQQQMILYDFYKFMFAQADLTKPESANWWFSKFPWMRDLRVEQINKQADLQKTLARIQITGPETEDDFMLLFLIRNGTITPPTHALNQMGQETAGIADTFKKGFFSRLVTGDFWNSPWPISPPTANLQVPWSNPTTTNFPGNYKAVTMESAFGLPPNAGAGRQTRNEGWQGILGTNFQARG